ncbi:hypothetical protein GCM10010095_79090 [Streptomyces anthocyanicus]|uniref:hypothetical protein n=1 Tax=Streptomyces anthocyanicus TaxID=68174 RepID=UPI0019888284|nr:hypothetical protein [Streptomyces anthocyanicus]GGL82530.1 hypothetical protein GCM10010095_79090 [Streptomyces anthocyanicus]
MTEDELIAVISNQTHAGNLAPVATPALIAAVDADVGHPMPRFLRRLHTEVSNGGFGIDGWECASLRLRQLENAGRRAGVTVFRGAHAG